jgi:hypothetical protein
MIAIHQSIPDARHPLVCTIDANKLNVAEFRQRAFNSRQLLDWLLPLLLLVSLGRFLRGRRQIDMATAMQLQQSNPAAHLLQITLVVAPSKPSTNVLRQLSTRKIGLLVYSCLYAIYYLWRKCLPTNIHASNLMTHSPCVQQKMWDMISL